MSITPTKRQYDDGCAVAQIMDVIGERWALLVIREMMFGPRRFGDLRAALPGISANVLTQRLDGLERAGIVRRRKLPPPASLHAYELTEWGMEAEPLFRVIGKWAARSPMLRPAPMSVASVILSLRTMFNPYAAGRYRAVVGFRFGLEEFVARIGDGRMDIEPGDASKTDICFDGDQNAFVAIVYGGVPVSEVESGGTLVIRGKREYLDRFISLFPLPERAPLPTL